MKYKQMNLLLFFLFTSIIGKFFFQFRMLGYNPIKFIAYSWFDYLHKKRLRRKRRSLFSWRHFMPRYPLPNPSPRERGWRQKPPLRFAQKCPRGAVVG